MRKILFKFFLWFYSDNIFQIRGGLIADYITKRSYELNHGCLCMCIHFKFWLEGDNYEQYGGNACFECEENAYSKQYLNKFIRKAEDIYLKWGK